MAVEELIAKLNSEEIYDIEDDNEIVECNFAIKHLCEDGYETTFAEMKYFDECFNEKRKFSAEEKNNFILKFNKGYINHRKRRDTMANYSKRPKDELEKSLTSIQYDVTQKNYTEPPFQNEYFNEFREGIYVDITTGEPLFISSEKFESGCGWPSFAKPIEEETITLVKDRSHGMLRTEVRSKLGDSHLGHVFEDGPKDMGGLRYCINSASLRFIAKEEMEQKGYGEYLKLLNEK